MRVVNIVKEYAKVLLISWLLLLQGCASKQSASRDEVNPVPMPQTFIVEGQAAVNNGAVLLAKKQALQEAIRKAVRQADEKSNRPILINQNPTHLDVLHPAASVSYTQVLNERLVNNLVTVRAKVTLAQDGTCKPNLRKRLIATAFPAAEPGQIAAAETNDLYGGIPRQINHLLMQSQDFMGYDATQTSLYEQPSLAPEIPAGAQYQLPKVLQLAKDRGVQLVLSGVIRDLQIDAGDYVRGTGPISMAKTWLRDVWSQRSIGLDVFVHDGFTGTLLFQHRYQEMAAGDVWLPANYTVGSAGFKNTVAGAKINGLIERASTDIRRALSCYPFATQIIKIEGQRVFIDAGAQEQLHAGDELVVYADTSTDLALEGGSQYVDRDKRPVGVLTLHEIRPRYAIGHLEVLPIKAGVKVGDWVKSW